SAWRPCPDSTPGPWTCSQRPSTRERALATASPPPHSPYSGSMSGLSEEQTRRVVGLAMDLARQGRTEELLEFLDHGLPANTQDEDGNSLLMLAAYHGHSATVTALIEQGADVDLRNGRNQSPVAGARPSWSRPVPTWTGESRAPGPPPRCSVARSCCRTEDEAGAQPLRGAGTEHETGRCGLSTTPARSLWARGKVPE